jgi:hypothetical protein
MDADGQDENNMSPQGEGRDIIKNDLFNQLMVVMNQHKSNIHIFASEKLPCRENS